MSNRAITIVFWLLSILAIAGSIGVHWRWGDAAIGVVGSYASVVGLILTGYVAVAVRQVKQRYVRRILLDSTYRKLCDKVTEFEVETTAERLRILAGSILPLIEEACLHLPTGKTVEWPRDALKTLIDNNDARKVNESAKVLRGSLAMVIEQFGIHRDREDWGRDDG